MKLQLLTLAFALLGAIGAAAAVSLIFSASFTFACVGIHSDLIHITFPQNRDTFEDQVVSFLRKGGAKAAAYPDDFKQDKEDPDEEYYNFEGIEVHEGCSGSAPRCSRMKGNHPRCCQYLNGHYWKCGACSSEALDSADFDSEDFEDKDVAAEDEADEFAEVSWCGGSCGHCKQRYCRGVHQRKTCKHYYCSAEELAEYFPEDLLINDQE